MPSSESSAQRKARLFAKVCGILAIAAFLIRVLVSGSMNMGLMILLLYIAGIALVSGIIRKRGSSRHRAVFIANAPMGILMVCATMFGETDRKIEFQILPYWVVAGIFLIIGLIVSTIVVFAIPKKNDTLAYSPKD